MADRQLSSVRRRRPDEISAPRSHTVISWVTSSPWEPKAATHVTHVHVNSLSFEVPVAMAPSVAQRSRSRALSPLLVVVAVALMTLVMTSATATASHDTPAPACSITTGRGCATPVATEGSHKAGRADASATVDAGKSQCCKVPRGWHQSSLRRFEGWEFGRPLSDNSSCGLRLLLQMGWHI